MRDIGLKERTEESATKERPNISRIFSSIAKLFGDKNAQESKGESTTEKFLKCVAFLIFLKGMRQLFFKRRVEGVCR